jgi:hypothetical protein
MIMIKFFLRLLVEHKRKKFIRACKNPQYSQEKLKKKILSISTIPFPDTPVDFNFYQGKSTSKQKIIFFESTSGSSGSRKQIPYTAGLLNTYKEMFLLWIHDLVLHANLDFKRGKFFMSISPQIGLNNFDDRKFLSPLLKFLISPFLVSDPEKHSAKTGEAFMKSVASDLVASGDLEAISVWSPTYLLSIIDQLEPLQTNTVWPDLKLISCWTEGQAQKSADKLRELFPNVVLQPKGLLLTEGPVTLPWYEAGGCIPLINLAYYELFDGEKLIPIYEGVEGKEYVIVMSQMNGYLRYNTNDRVKIKGYYHKVPVLTFLGREGVTVDLAGEKLSEQIIQSMFFEIKQDFFLIPDVRHTLPGYVLIHEEGDIDWEKRLFSIHHYRLARELRQLLPLKCIQVEKPRELYMNFLQSQGIPRGSIKESVLLNNLSLSGRLLEQIERSENQANEAKKNISRLTN